MRSDFSTFISFFQSVYDSFDPYNKGGDQQPSSLTPAKSTDYLSQHHQPSSLQPHHTPNGMAAASGSPARVNGGGYSDRYSLPPPMAAGAGENNSAIANASNNAGPLQSGNHPRYYYISNSIFQQNLIFFVKRQRLTFPEFFPIDI